MRKILTLILLSAYLAAPAQQSKTVSIYGYMQPSHPGIVPAHYPNATLADYLIYIAAPRNSSFKLQSVRVGGKSYYFQIEAAPSPVTRQTENMPRKGSMITLVPATTRNVMQVILKKGPDRPGAGPLSVTYRLNGKTVTKTMVWKELEPRMNE